jgi:hypothetical protein
LRTEVPPSLKSELICSSLSGADLPSDVDLTFPCFYLPLRGSPNMPTCIFYRDLFLLLFFKKKKKSFGLCNSLSSSLERSFIYRHANAMSVLKLKGENSKAFFYCQEESDKDFKKIIIIILTWTERHKLRLLSKIIFFKYL